MFNSFLILTCHLCVGAVKCIWSSAAAGLWTLHTVVGQNIQLHFLDFDVEANFDIVEVRDGAGPNSSLLGEVVFCP